MKILLKEFFLTKRKVKIHISYRFEVNLYCLKDLQKQEKKFDNLWILNDVKGQRKDVFALYVAVIFYKK